jgi:hypothetical protein
MTDTISFHAERAPCGRIVEGERLRDTDDECMLTEEVFFACGCQVVRHEYHDGSVSCREMRHDGRVLADKAEYHI